MDIDIIKIENIDTQLFNILNTDKNNYIPLAIKVGNKYYQISGFNNLIVNSQYVYLGEKDFVSGINLFIDNTSSIDFLGLCKIAKLSIELEIDGSDIKLFKEKNYRGNKTQEVLVNILGLPENIKNYLNKKDIPLKTISLLLSQKENIINFLDGYLEKNEPSTQMFRKYLENLCDFKDIIPDSYSEEFAFPDRRSNSRKEIEETYDKLTKQFKKANIINNNSFETPVLNLSCNINSISDYDNLIEELLSNKEKIRNFYKVLKDNDLC